jgi:hypothetical protein
MGEGKYQDRSQDQFTTAAKLDNLVSQTGPSSFSGFSTEEDFEDQHVRDGTITLFVSSRTHAQ